MSVDAGALRLGTWMAEPTMKGGTTSIVALAVRRPSMADNLPAAIASRVMIEPGITEQSEIRTLTK